MADTGIIKLEGWTELIDDLKRVPQRYEAEVRNAMRAQARKLIARAAVHAPRKSGNLANHTSVTISRFRMTITWTEPYSGAIEWGRTWTRGGPYAGEVTIHALGPPPRFAWRAWTELQGTFADEMAEAINTALARTGYWELV